MPGCCCRRSSNWRRARKLQAAVALKPGEKTLLEYLEGKPNVLHLGVPDHLAAAQRVLAGEAPESRAAE